MKNQNPQMIKCERNQVKNPQLLNHGNVVKRANYEAENLICQKK